MAMRKRSPRRGPSPKSPEGNGAVVEIQALSTKVRAMFRLTDIRAAR